MSSVRVIVPFYGSDPLRKRNLQAVIESLSELPTEFQVEVVPGRTLAQARNKGVSMSIDPVVVFCDADTLCPTDQIAAAAEMARLGPGQVFAFDTYLRLTEQATARVLSLISRPENETVEREFFAPPTNGCMAISRFCFDELGGYDTSYDGWGYEDVDFNMRAQALWSPRRVEGEAYHLWHGPRRADDSPADSDPLLVAANLARLRGTG